MDSSAAAIHAYVLGAQRGRRRLDNARSTPPSLRDMPGGETVLDWLLHALGASGITKITYAGGYHIEKVIDRFPGLTYRFFKDWATISECALADALLAAHSGADALLVSGNLVMLPDAIGRLMRSDGQVVLATYGAQQTLAGIALIRRGAVARIRDDVADAILSQAPLSLAEVVRRQSAIAHDEVDLSDLVAPIDDQVSANRIVFAGKGRTLEQIRPLLTCATVLDLVRVTVARWRRSPAECIADIKRGLFADRLIVRSSTVTEDGPTGSYAGHFLSIADVPRNDDAALAAAIDRVVASYSRDGRNPPDGDEILIQPLITDLTASGVLLTRDVDTAAPYFVLNIDSTSGRADAVTSGAAAKIETYYVAWNNIEGVGPPAVTRSIALARELVRLTGLDALDIEFALAADGRLYLLQVRPFAPPREMDIADEDLLDTIADARRFVRTKTTTSPLMVGRSTVLGTMTDWNPAEMIGLAPTALALSLYQRLIGDQSWAEARAAIGYRDVRPVPLVVSVGGIPYVDVRASLNSFLPASLDDDTGGIWVDHCLERLGAQPELHDKVEFEVTLTCLDADVDATRARMKAAGLSTNRQDRFTAALRDLTNLIVRQRAAGIDALLDNAKRLKRTRLMAEARSGDAPQVFAAAHALLDDCRAQGVVPFSILARYAFIALALLRSLRAVGALEDADIDLFMRAVPTVAGEFTRDMRAHARGDLSRDQMILRYGHLRPRTYQITSPCYASEPERFFSMGGNDAQGPGNPPDPAAILSRRAIAIDRALADAGIEIDHRQLAAFAAAAISGREKAKFEFTKNLSLALEKLAEGGAVLGLDRAGLAHLPIDMLLRFATNAGGMADASNLRRNASFNEKKWRITRALKMPDLIASEAEIGAFQFPEGQPNFITRERVVAPCVMVEGPAQAGLEGKIVLVQAADPGFDWIFAHPISGLVTQFGGVASHMAIRAMEFNLPAAIGCGAQLFSRLARATAIELDCANRKVAPAAP